MAAAVTPPLDSEVQSLETRIKEFALELGFDLAGIARLGPADTAPHFQSWLDRGFAGDMDYLQRGAGKRIDSRLPFPGAKSAIVVALNYGGTSAAGPVARYARGDDYHDVMTAKLQRLQERISSISGTPIRARPYVDTGPILERDLARRAGLGWFGKNTNLINPRIGSFFFIGALLVDLELSPDRAFETDHCGTCTRCIDACPTQAITEPLVLDANRCISYLTIETRDGIPAAFRAAVGDLAYGCDICQDVCPWNVRFSQDLTDPALTPRAETEQPDLLAWLGQSDAEFAARFRGSPMKRAKRRGLARNAAVALGNSANKSSVPALEAARDAEMDEMVREHIDWAIDKIRGRCDAAS